MEFYNGLIKTQPNFQVDIKEFKEIISSIVMTLNTFQILPL